MTLHDDLKAEIAAGKVAVVVSAGVSLLASGGADVASWPGLIKSGAKFATEVNATLPPTWLDNVQGDIKLGIEHSYTPGLIAAAEKITDALGGRTGGEFKRWLRQDLESLPIKDRAILDAITGLGCPILTTNYDHLLENSSPRQTATWKEPSQMQMILRGESSDIGHLHGSWRYPDTLIFGSTSYGEVLGDTTAQAIQRSMATMNTILFIGAGDGLGDPNFKSFIEWLDANFGDSEVRHYRLCRESDRAALTAQHADSRITPLPYGPDYEELVPFLEALAPSEGSARVAEVSSAYRIQSKALEAIEDRVTSVMILSEHFLDDRVRTIDELMIPPVLLPMTPEQYATAHGLEGEKPKRSKPDDDLRDHKCLVIAADERAGLTTAIQWLAARASTESPAAPVFVDFRSLVSVVKPLDLQLHKEFMSAGVVQGRTDDLPGFVLGLDNVTIKPEKIFDRVVQELTSNAASSIIIGVRRGDEAEVVSRLQAVGLQPALRYLGRLNTKDITALAALVVPSRANAISERAIELMSREHLPRTPLTACLLISALLHGEALLSTASETALLDGYVSLLLGRGDPHEDARFSLDSLEREAVLAVLAEHFVNQNTGSGTEAEVIRVLTETFDTFGWTEDPIEVLSSFKVRNLLQVREKQVGFAHSSYLHLFGAKRAIASPEFRRKIYARPLHFGQVIRHYAALTRNDAEALKTVSTLLWWPVPNPEGGGAFAPSEELAPGSPTSMGEMVAHLESIDPSETNFKPRESAENLPDALDRLDDRDTGPFPFDRIEDASPVRRVLTLLGLVSNVLRDSELVTDLDLKRRVLQQTLSGWGHFVQVLEADEDFKEYTDKLAVVLVKDLGVPSGKAATFREDFVELAPVLIGLGGMSSQLASRKLQRTLQRAFLDEDFQEDVRGSVMGALLGFDLQAERWPELFQKVQATHGSVHVVDFVLQKLAMSAYLHQNLTPEDEASLSEFLTERMMPSTVKAQNERDRRQWESNTGQRLKAVRLRNSRKQLSAGDTIPSSSEDEA